MKATPTEIPDVVLLEPTVYRDERGFFFESYNRQVLRDLLGRDVEFVQDNHSRSARNVLRGLHYQVEQAQGKLVRCIIGEVFDVAVDLRRRSSSFGKWVGYKLSAENQHMLWIPPGFAHGFLVLSESADVLYKTTDYWAPKFERTVIWNDPRVGIDWPVGKETPELAPRDLAGLPLQVAEVYP
jgi:dTDP-4-dehydrorhamnose 3,5-epimerase